MPSLQQEINVARDLIQRAQRIAETVAVVRRGLLGAGEEQVRVRGEPPQGAPIGALGALEAAHGGLAHVLDEIDGELTIIGEVCLGSRPNGIAPVDRDRAKLFQDLPELPGQRFVGERGLRP